MENQDWINCWNAWQGFIDARAKLNEGDQEDFDIQLGEKSVPIESFAIMVEAAATHRPKELIMALSERPELQSIFDCVIKATKIA